MSTSKQESGHISSGKLWAHCTLDKNTLCHSIALFTDQDYEDALRDKFEGMEEREDLVCFSFHFLAIFTTEPQLVNEIMDKIMAGDRFRTSHPKIVKFMQKRNFAYLVHADKAIVEVIKEHAALTEKVESGQISKAQMDELLEKTVDRIQALIDSGTKSATPPLRLGSVGALEKLMHTVTKGFIAARGSSVPEPGQPRPFVPTLMNSGSSSTHTIILFLNHQEILLKEFAELEARKDIDFKSFLCIHVGSCDEKEATESLSKFTSHPLFPVLYPKVARLKKQNMLGIVMNSDAQTRRMIQEHLALRKIAMSGRMPAHKLEAIIAKNQARRDASRSARASCASCGKTADSGNVKLQLCSGCRSVAYCSVAHQQADWPHHKPHCRKAKAQSVKPK